jgi:hypothetical protein
MGLETVADGGSSLLLLPPPSFIISSLLLSTRVSNKVEVVGTK